MAMIQQPTPRERGMASIGQILAQALPGIPLDPLIDEDEPDDQLPARIPVNTTAAHTVETFTCNEYCPPEGHCGKPAIEGLCEVHRKDRIDWHEFMRKRQEDVKKPWN